MPKSTLALKATVTRRQAVEPVDQLERQLQTDHHQAVAAASTGAEPAQDQDQDKAHQTTVEAATALEPEKPGTDLKQNAHALQIGFLMANLNKPVAIFLVNGLRLTGKLKQYDQFTLLIESQDGIRSLVFKHAITTIAPTSEAPRKQHQ